MKVSGFAAVAVMVAGAALMPSTASAAVFELNSCVAGACGNFTGLVKITITDNAVNSNDVDFLVENMSNGEIDYVRLGYETMPDGDQQVRDFAEVGDSKVNRPTASFGAVTDAGVSYNVSFDSKSGVGNRFDAGEAISFTLGSTSTFNFDASRFSSMLAHVVELKIGGQDVTLTNGGGSPGGGGETVPEPASIALFGFAALAAGRRLRRRNVK